MRYIRQKDEIVNRPNVFTGRGKRTQASRESDLEYISKLYLSGGTQRGITQAINERAREEGRGYEITLQQVQLDIKVIQEAWREHYITDGGRYMYEQLAKLDKLEGEYWDAWERSKNPRKFTEASVVQLASGMPVNTGFSERGMSGENDESDEGGEGRFAESPGRDGGGTVKNYNKVRRLEREESVVGEVKYLEGVERVIAQRCRILGIGQTTNVNINWRKQASSAGVDPDEIVNSLMEKFLNEAWERGEVVEGEEVIRELED